MGWSDLIRRDFTEIAIKALEGKLADKIDQAVESKNNDKGFKGDFTSLQPQNLVNSKNLLIVILDDCHKIGNLSAFKEELIKPPKKIFVAQTKGGNVSCSIFNGISI